MTALISTNELAARLNDPSWVAVNGSWHMPSEKRNAQAEHVASHIPGARFFNLDAISDPHSSYPHMLPSPATFEKAVGLLGIGNKTHVVVYDTQGLFSAARIWWMFRVFGHDNVQVLDGGFPKWLAEKRPVESGLITPHPVAFTASYRSELVRSFEDIQRNLATQYEQVVDARASGRFNGTEPEPRAGLRSGHIPGSFNLSFRECTIPPYHVLKKTDDLKELFKSRKVDLSRPVIASCGSGVTACVLALALHELGLHNVPVYDGSWAEWASRTTS